MFLPFRRHGLSDRLLAIKRGELVDMQVPPFRQFNEIVNNYFKTVMTKAAYQACVQLPGEKMNGPVPANYRWGIVYVSFATAFQDRLDDPQKGTFDVSVLMPDGFQVPRTLKVVSDNDFDGEEAFVFLLPDEPWPMAS